MSLLAEEIVEEWLNRDGYFTIRGIKIGVDEIDILAIKPSNSGDFERRHFEVTVSIRPVSYISRLPKAIQKGSGRAPNTSKRSWDEVVEGVGEWVENKFRKKKKLKIMNALCPGDWTSELVVNVVKFPDELKEIERHGIRIHKLPAILKKLGRNGGVIQSACGADLMDLVQMSRVKRKDSSK
jgi:hypothetical protein